MLVAFKILTQQIDFLSENFLVPQGNGIKEGKDNYFIKPFAS